MLKTLVTGSALAMLLAFAAQAQEAPDVLPHSETTPSGNPQVPSATSDAPLAPEMADEPLAPRVAEPPLPQTAEDGSAPPDIMAPDTVTGAPAGPLPEGWAPVDLATVTADMLIGADIRTYEGDTIAAVDDVLMSVDGRIENVVARFGGFLGFGETRVVLAPEEVTLATDADGDVSVLTRLAADEVKGRPEFVAPEGADTAG